MNLRQWYRGARYLDQEERLAALPRRRQWLEAAVAPGARVLDVGCLGGLLVRGVAGRSRVVGVDIIFDALVQARRWGLVPVQADAACPFPFRDASFDVVHAGEVLEHVFDPLALMREMTRVLRPGGQLVGTSPNVVSLGDRCRAVLGRPPASLGLYPDAPAGDHIRALTVNRIHHLGREAGLVDFRPRAIATGGARPWRMLKECRTTWGDLVWFAFRRPLRAGSRSLERP